MPSAELDPQIAPEPRGTLGGKADYGMGTLFLASRHIHDKLSQLIHARQAITLVWPELRMNRVRMP